MTTISAPVKSILSVILLFFLCSYTHTTDSLPEIAFDQAWPGTLVDPELRPLLEQFINVSRTSGIQLPMARKISRIQILPHEDMLKRIKSKGDVMAVTFLDVSNQNTEILLSDELKSEPQELRILLFHELLHVAGFNHPNTLCNWADSGCGIMGFSSYPRQRLSQDQADRVIHSSFRIPYLANLPKITALSH